MTDLEYIEQRLENQIKWYSDKSSQRIMRGLL